MNDKRSKPSGEDEIEFVPVEDLPSKDIRKDDRVQFGQKSENVVSETLRPNTQRIALLVVGVALCFVLYLWWSERSSHFPRIQPGAYLGTIDGVFQGETKPVRLYIEQSSTDDSLFLVVLRQGWRPELVDSSAIGDEESHERLFPVTIVSPEGKLRFTGDRISESGYGGIVYDLDNHLKGSWRVALIETDSVQEISADLSVKTKLWLLLKAELQEVEKKISEAEEVVPKQQAQIDKLSKYITEGEGLKARAQEKFDEAKRELEETRKAFKEKQQQAVDLARQLDISQRVTGMGKLVSLARETFDRESRWVATLLKSSVKPDSPDFQKTFSQAEKILEIKKQISLEREAIYKLTHKDEVREGVAVEEVPRQ